MMPVAKIHVHEGVFTADRLAAMGQAIQDSLEEVLGVPPDDYFRIVHVLPEGSFVHTPSFLGLNYSREFVLLELSFIKGHPRETRLALLKALNDKAVAAAGISPDDLAVYLYEVPGENISFGQGLAQRAHIGASADD